MDELIVTYEELLALKEDVCAGFLEIDFCWKNDDGTYTVVTSGVDHEQESF